VSEDFPALAGFRAGSLVAGYRLEAQVGAGGMAVVFRAHDERPGPAAIGLLVTQDHQSDERGQHRVDAHRNRDAETLALQVGVEIPLPPPAG
jgi:hypothetical protein